MSANVSSVSTVNQLPAVAVADLKVSVLKSGATAFTCMKQKEYGEIHGLKGAALRRAHFAYRVEQMKLDRKATGHTLLENENIGITRRVVSEDGTSGTISWKLIDSLKAPKATKEEKASQAVDLSKLSESDIMAYLESKGYEVIVAE